MEGEGNLGHWLPGLEGAFSIQIVICGILSAAYHCTTRKNYEDKLVKRTAKKGIFLMKSFICCYAQALHFFPL